MRVPLQVLQVFKRPPPNLFEKSNLESNHPWKEMHQEETNCDLGWHSAYLSAGKVTKSDAARVPQARASREGWDGKLKSSGKECGVVFNYEVAQSKTPLTLFFSRRARRSLYQKRQRQRFLQAPPNLFEKSNLESNHPWKEMHQEETNCDLGWHSAYLSAYLSKSPCSCNAPRSGKVSSQKRLQRWL